MMDPRFDYPYFKNKDERAARRRGAIMAISILIFFAALCFALQVVIDRFGR